MDLEVEHPGVKQSMLKALRNVMPRFLLDTRLNPSGELRDSAALRLDEAAASSLIQIQHSVRLPATSGGRRRCEPSSSASPRPASSWTAA